MAKIDDPKIVALLRRGFAPSEAQKIYDRENLIPTVWQPNTFYSAGTFVVTPGGYLASALVDFTSSAVYNASNWQEYIPGAELAYAENNTGVEQTGLANATYDGTGLVLVVPVCPRPVYLEGFVTVTTTTAPAAGTTATFTGFFTETVNSVDTSFGACMIPLAGGSGNGSATLMPKVRIGPVAAPRTFRFQATKIGASTTVWKIGNGAAGSAYKSWVRATVA